MFGCLYYPNLSSIASHKLAPHSTICVFLGYSPHHKRYCCLDFDSKCVIISRHVIFDEIVFPFARRHTTTPADFEFLDDITADVPISIGPSHPSLICLQVQRPHSHVRQLQFPHNHVWLIWTSAPPTAASGTARIATCGPGTKDASCPALSVPQCDGGVADCGRTDQFTLVQVHLPRLQPRRAHHTLQTEQTQ